MTVSGTRCRKSQTGDVGLCFQHRDAYKAAGTLIPPAEPEEAPRVRAPRLTLEEKQAARDAKPSPQALA